MPEFTTVWSFFAVRSDNSCQTPVGFRDNLLYFTLGIFGVVLTFSLGSQTRNNYGLILLPWVSLILGWTYLVNDQKISAIGRYIRNDLATKVIKQFGDLERKSVFEWESKNLQETRRRQRKIEQLLIDEVAFVASGIAGLGAFLYLEPQVHWLIQLLCLVELILLLILGYEIFSYSELAPHTKTAKQVPKSDELSGSEN